MRITRTARSLPAAANASASAPYVASVGGFFLSARSRTSCNMPSDFVILTWSAISFPFDRSLGAARKYPLRSGDAACRIRSARSFKPVSPERSGSSDPGETEGGLTPQRAPRSEEHTSELQSLMRISYAGFCLKKKNKQHITEH